MSHPYHHALSSVKQFGGIVEDYLEIHNWFDATKAYMGDVRHRALRHHTLGIFDCEKIFGEVIVNSDNKSIPVRVIAEQHVYEDLGKIPTPQDWLDEMRKSAWMMRNTRKLSLELAEPAEEERMKIHDS
jgi:hypothetical protein